MDDDQNNELRRRYNSSMTYQQYIDDYGKIPEKPRLKPKETPQQQLEILQLDTHMGPKLQRQQLQSYQPDEVIMEESETDEKSRACSPNFQFPTIKIKDTKKLKRESSVFSFAIYKLKMQELMIIQFTVFIANFFCYKIKYLLISPLKYLCLIQKINKISTRCL
ncbi:hypothetical protein pb186bvf_013908 [Paramecium bursaria]